MTALHTLNNTVAKGFNQMAPPARTITVVLYMSKALGTINIHTLHQGTQNLLFLTMTTTQTFPQTPTQSLQQTCAIYIHLLSLGIQPQETITKYCAHLHHTLAALKRDFPDSLVAPLPNSEQTNLPSSNHTYTKSMPKHIHHHYAPSVTSTHTTHIISSTAPT